MFREIREEHISAGRSPVKAAGLDSKNASDAEIALDIVTIDKAAVLAIHRRRNLWFVILQVAHVSGKTNSILRNVSFGRLSRLNLYFLNKTTF